MGLIPHTADLFVRHLGMMLMAFRINRYDIQRITFIRMRHVSLRGQYESIFLYLGSMRAIPPQTERFR